MGPALAPQYSRISMALDFKKIIGFIIPLGIFKLVGCLSWLQKKQLMHISIAIERMLYYLSCMQESGDV